MNSISVKELKAKIDNNEAHQLIDVREDYEFEAGNINGLHIPMGEIPNNLDKISTENPVIIHCKSGKRSASVIQYLEAQGFSNLYNLEGGILAWQTEIDSSVSVM